MNLRALIAGCRGASRDTKKPYLWADGEWTSALNEAGREACIRSRLIENEEIELDQSANDAYSEIPDHIWSIQRVTFNGRKLILCDKAMLDDCEGEAWEVRTADIPVSCYEVGGKLRLYPIPTTSGTVLVHGFCIPENDLSDDNDEPDWLRPRLHEKLIDWALHCFYSTPDADIFDGKRADVHEEKFEQVFGPRPDEKAMRRLRINVRRYVKGHSF